MRAIREDARIYYIPTNKVGYVGLLNMCKYLHLPHFSMISKTI
jgi:hypothetical protein